MKPLAVTPASSSPADRRRRWLIPVLLLLLVSLACSIPNLGQTSPTQPGPTSAPVQPSEETRVAPQGAQAPQPTPAVDLPPTLVEVDPLPNSEIAPGAAPVFYFSQPMERASVESSFQVQPEQAGSFEWLDDATVRFVPDTPPAEGTDFNVTIDTGAKAANGLALPEPVQVSYQSAGPLRLTELLPAPEAVEVNPSSAVVATFNRPVVALGADSQSLPPAFNLEPAAVGRGEWLNTSTYIFYPEPALMGGTNYTARLNGSLTSVDGVPLSDDSGREWSFSTSSPVLLSLTPGPEQPVPLDSSFVLTFNQPMETASVEADFSLIRQDGELIPGKFSWNEQNTELIFEPNDLLQRSMGYTIALFGTARSQGGAALGQDFASALSTVPQFSVTETRPAAGETLNAFGGYGSIALTFSSPIAAGQNFNELISLDPPIVNQFVYRDFNGYQLFVSGYFQPSTNYSLTVEPELRDRWDAALGTAYSFTFTSQAALPALVIPVRQVGAQALFVPQNETSLPAQSTNIHRVNLSRGKLTLNEFIQATQDWEGVQEWEAIVQSSWPLVLYPKPDVSEPVNIPLAQNGTALDSGLYFLNIAPEPASDQMVSPPALVVVSQIQMVFKTSARQAFVWAVRVADNTPAADLQISVYDHNVAVLGSCTTDTRGACELALPERKDPYRPLFAVLGQPGDLNFSLSASDWYNGVASWEFNLSFQNEGFQPEVYLYTERPIYRPGQAVNFRVAAREQDNGRYAAPKLNQVTVEVVSPYDVVTGQSQVLTTMRLPLNTYGTASATYRLPDDARPGSYLLRVNEAENETLFFQVAEYRKPEIDLQVKFSQPGVLAGNDIQAQVNTRYFFGAPAGNLSVRWSLFRKAGYVEIPGGLSAGKADTNWLEPWEFHGVSETYLMEGQTHTAPDGTATIDISGQDLLARMDTAAGDLQNLIIEVTVEDESGLPVSARAEMQQHPSPYYIGVKPEQWSVEAGQEITYTIRSVDWQGGPASGKPLSARFQKVVWEQEEIDDLLAPPSYRAVYTEVGSTNFTTSDQGEARLAFIPAEPGTYMLEVSGEEGALTQVLSWVGGPGSTLWPNLPNQRILLRSDAAAYTPGQTAKVFIPNPFEGEALALITVERGKVMRSFVETIEEASYELDLALGEEDAPNIYLSVTLLGRTGGRPDFRQGYLELAVDPTAQMLQVELDTSPEQPQPGGELTVNIRVKDAQGSPVQGEFSLALVDKAVLALADPNSPSIEQAFYGIQPLGVQSSFSLANYAGRFVYGPPGRGGGGGGDMQVAPPVRTEFEDTAYWNGEIQTDVSGVAQVTLTLPDNLTTWRAEVCGLTTDTRVGQAEIDLVTSKPLLVRPVAPRFAVLGDHLELAAVVQNNTQAAMQVSVRLAAAGFNLDDPDQAAQGIDLPAGERVRVSWWGTVQDVEALDLTFSAETISTDAAAVLRDAAGPENGPLPVLRYTSPQTFGTSGILAQAGEQLELVSLPRSFTPSGGELRLELSPSLSAAVLDGLEALEAYPRDFTEPILSHMLPNLAALEALNDLQLRDETLRGSLESAITEDVGRLARMQGEDGGWGWAAGYASDPYISSYVLLGLSKAAQLGYFVDPQVLEKGKAYLSGALFAPNTSTEAWKLDRLAFQQYALHSAGFTDLDLGPLTGFKDRLSPWAKAFLALTLDGQSPGDARARTIISDLAASASRSATGANWQDANPTWHNWSTPNFTTAVTAYAIARLDPTSQVLIDAVRYLTLNRSRDGAWTSSYETAWVLLALTETMKGTGDLQANYTYSAELNGAPLIEGKVENAAQAVNPVSSTLALNSLRADAPNALTIRRDEGTGRLYYRAYLEVSRPAEEAEPVQRGLAITRQYYRAGKDCRQEACQPLDTVDLADPQPVLVRLTLTVPEDMYYVVVEDTIPAGTEVLNPRLKTSQQNIVPEEGQEPVKAQPPFDLENPFESGWGWWRFKDPQVYDDHVRWVVDTLPAGTYELTYRLTPFLAGEFRVIPAHAWQYYFPEVEGTSKGGILKIE